MRHSVQEIKNLLVFQFSKYSGNDAFEIIEENLLSASPEKIPGWDFDKGSLEITFVVPDFQEVWQVAGREKRSGNWRFEAFSFIGAIELTSKQEQLLEQSFNTVWQDEEVERQGHRALEEALDRHYSKFNDDQLDLLNRINPTTPNGISFTPCRNAYASAQHWWIRAEMEAKEPDLHAILEAGRFTIPFMRKKLDSLKVHHSMVGFDDYMSGGI